MSTSINFLLESLNSLDEKVKLLVEMCKYRTQIQIDELDYCKTAFDAMEDATINANLTFINTLCMKSGTSKLESI